MTRQIYEFLSRQNKNKPDFSIKFTFMTKSNPAKLVQTCVSYNVLKLQIKWVTVSFVARCKMKQTVADLLPPQITP